MSVHPNTLKNLKSWPKGVSGNAGRRYQTLPENLRGIKSLGQAEVNRLISKYARMIFAGLKERLEDPNTPVLELAIARLFQESINQADFNKLKFLLDRCIGRVPDVVEEEEEETDAREEVARLSMTELLTLVKTNLPALENI